MARVVSTHGFYQGEANPSTSPIKANDLKEYNQTQVMGPYFCKEQFELIRANDLKATSRDETLL